MGIGSGKLARRTVRVNIPDVYLVQRDAEPWSFPRVWKSVGDGGVQVVTRAGGATAIDGVQYSAKASCG